MSTSVSRWAWLPALLGLGGLFGLSTAGGCVTEPYCFNCDEGGGAPDAGTGGAGGSTGCTANADCGGGTKLCCDGVCSDTDADPENCGVCGNSCDAQHASTTCDKGECKAACESGFGDCDLLAGTGCETSLSSDPLNCGGCGNVCLFANAVPGCAGGTCGIAMCKMGFADCDGMLANGCEASLGTDPKNCGGCAMACPTPNNTVSDCVAAMCVPIGCADGFGDCDGDPADGCEVALLTDGSNCGTCGTVCPPLPHAQPACNAGACGVGVCDAGWADCDLSVWSGCESELATDVSNCGACGAPCGAVAHGFPICTGGACAVGGCDPGYADCDGDLANGCEVNLADDVANCGACANACPAVVNGQPICAGFQCGIGSCDAGFADCYGGAADGCETNLQTDADHCGTCGTICPLVAQGQRACNAGVCGIGSCSAEYADCNLQAADGCEASLQTDVSNCAACGNACPAPPNASPSCTAGACGLGACNAGFSDCNGNPADGCELDTTLDANNCGGCGIQCGSGTCVSSACVCLKTVLLIADDSASGSATLAAALTSAGYVVTQTAVPSYQYNGTNPPLAGFGSVVVLAGGPAATSYSTDMPAAGQTAIAAFVNAGNGLVLTEWAAFQVAGGRWQTLAPFVLLTRTQAYSGQVTYQIDPAFTNHPVWAGLPASFTFASTSNVGITKLAAGVRRIASSPQAIDAVAIRDAPVGRVVHIAHAGDYAPNGWTNANIQKLMANAVGWSARCQ